MPRFIALDSWRGICACMIVLVHFPSAGLISNLPVVQNGYLFVDFFFVLSGFVIQANYRHRVEDVAGLSKFMFTRFGRLYPLHLFMLLCFIALETIQMLPQLSGLGASEPFSGEAVSPFAVVTNLFLVHGLGMHSVVTWNSVSWSISTELWAYVAFGVATLILGKRAIVAAAIVCIAAPVYLYFVSPHGMNTTFDYGYIRCIFGFSAGMICFEAYDRFLHSARLGRWVASLLEILAFVGVVAFVSVVGETSWSLLAPAVFFAAILVFSKEEGVLSYILVRPFPELLGTLSYSIYMVHIFIQTFWTIGGVVAGKLIGYQFVLDVPNAHGDGIERSYGQTVWQGDLATVLMLASVIFVSYFPYHWIEDPWRKRFKSMASHLMSPKLARERTA